MPNTQLQTGFQMPCELEDLEDEMLMVDDLEDPMRLNFDVDMEEPAPIEKISSVAFSMK